MRYIIRFAPTRSGEFMTQTIGTHDWAVLQHMFLAYREGDAQIVEKLFSTLAPIVRGFFIARTRNPADSDDLAQAALLKIHFSRHSFNQALSLKTWIFTISHRTLIDHWRKKSHHAKDEPLENLDLKESINSSDLINSFDLDLMNRLSLRKFLEQALDQLKPLDRTIVYLSVEEGLTMAEIAEVVNSTEGAIKVRLHRALKGMRNFLKMANTGREAHE